MTKLSGFYTVTSTVNTTTKNFERGSTGPLGPALVLHNSKSHTGYWKTDHNTYTCYCKLVWLRETAIYYGYSTELTFPLIIPIQHLEISS